MAKVENTDVSEEVGEVEGDEGAVAVTVVVDVAESSGGAHPHGGVEESGEGSVGFNKEGSDGGDNRTHQED